MDKAIRVLLFLFCFLLCAYPTKALQNYEVGNIRYISFSTHTQIIIEKTAQTDCLPARELTSPPRLLINLFPAVLLTYRGRAEVGYQEEIAVGDNFIQGVRLKQEHESILQIVIDLSITEYTYNISSQEPDSLVIDIRGPRDASDKDLVVDLLKKIELSPFTPSVSPEKKGKVFKIVLDPGHGGDDPGAVGPSGLKEKDVVLAVAKELANLLEKEPGIEVHWSREKDRFVYLYRRAEMANQIGGNIFISIHANAAPSRTATGVETFVNSMYAEDKEAALVAARENKPAEFEGISGEAKALLLDMIQNKYKSESNDLAHSIQKRLSEATGLEDRGVKRAPFRVLRWVAMPAVLVEIGFISNAWEESKLKKDDFRKKIAQGILDGLRDYLKKIELITQESIVEN